jgi:hypothetical protein
MQPRQYHGSDTVLRAVPAPMCRRHTHPKAILNMIGTFMWYDKVGCHTIIAITMGNRFVRLRYLTEQGLLASSNWFGGPAQHALAKPCLLWDTCPPQTLDRSALLIRMAAPIYRRAGQTRACTYRAGSAAPLKYLHNTLKRRCICRKT